MTEPRVQAEPPHALIKRQSTSVRPVISRTYPCYLIAKLAFCEVESLGSSRVYSMNSGAPGIYFRRISGTRTP